MKCQTNIIPIQQLPSGDWLTIRTYKFKGEGSKRVYIQANIHGPEVTGVIVAKQLIDWLGNHTLGVKEVVVIPSCNPMGLNAQIMGQQLGYINLLSGTNWNRIYPNITCKRDLHLGLRRSLKLEDRLGFKLMELSWDADIVIDLHTAWGKAPHYIYCYKEHLKEAKSFKVENIFILDESVFEGVFDEAHNGIERKHKQIFTLELGSDCSLENGDIKAGVGHVLSFFQDQKLISDVSEEVFKGGFDICQVKDYQYIYSPVGGFLVWKILPGEYFEKDQEIAHILSLNDLKTIPIKIGFAGKIIIQFNAKAVHQGQAIGKVMRSYLHSNK